MVFLVLLGIPLLIAVGGFVISKEITWKEFLVQLGVQMVIAGICACVMYFGQTHDTEVWNGVVVDKKENTVSCSHSYQCNCRNESTGSGKDRSCSTVCDTCYEHFHDYDWDVYTSNSEVITIDRIDRQGVSQPPRWTATKMGEPTVVEHSYTNYIKVAPDSLFRHQGLVEKYKDQIPAYPQRVYDYYREDRMVLDGVSLPDVALWNADLSKINSEIGSAKQVNIIVVLTTKPREFFYAVEESWIGGKKNDVIVMIGVDQDLKPVWSEVMAWAIANALQVKMRGAVLDQAKLEHGATLKLIQDNVFQNFKRKPMRDFEYLSASVSPTTFQLTLCTLFVTALACGLSWVFHSFDPFSDAQRSKKYRKSRRMA
jgi:hypothetical protein